MDTPAEQPQNPTLYEALDALLQKYQGADEGFHRAEVRVANPHEVLCRVYPAPGEDYDSVYVNL